MAMSQRSPEELEESSEINLTPFIDVILVLLIIFMIAAQASSVSQQVDLPASKAQSRPLTEHPVIVTVQAGGTYTVNERQVAPADLAASLKAAGATPDDRILLIADRKMAYEGVMGALDALRDAGFSHVGLVARERT